MLQLVCNVETEPTAQITTSTSETACLGCRQGSGATQDAGYLGSFYHVDTQLTAQRLVPTDVGATGQPNPSMSMHSLGFVDPHAWPLEKKGWPLQATPNGGADGSWILVLAGYR